MRQVLRFEIGRIYSNGLVQKLSTLGPLKTDFHVISEDRRTKKITACLARVSAIAMINDNTPLLRLHIVV